MTNAEKTRLITWISSNESRSEMPSEFEYGSAAADYWEPTYSVETNKLIKFIRERM